MLLRSGKDIELAGFNGMRGVSYVDQGNVVLGEETMGTAQLRKQVALRKALFDKHQKMKKAAVAKKAQAVEKKKEILKHQQIAKKQRAMKAVNTAFAKKFMLGRMQPVMGYDYTSLLGNPHEGFGSGEVYLQGINMCGEGYGEYGIGDAESWDNGMGFFKVPKISLPKIRVPTFKDIGKAVTRVVTAPVAVGAHVAKQVGGKKLETAVSRATGVSITQAARGGESTLKQVGKAAGAVSKFPAQAVQKTVQQVGGKNLEKFLDRTTGGTYTQAIKVGQLPGKALASEKITKDDIDALKGLATKAAVAAAMVYTGGSISGAASNLVQQKAAAELGKKVGGSAGSLIASAGSLASGDFAGAGKTFAQEEAKRHALKEAQKKLGKEAGSILAIGVAGAKGGVSAAVQQSKDIAKEKAYGAVAKKTGIPIDLVKAVQSGKVPSADQVKSAMQSELKAAPDKLRAELQAMPAKIAAAPANAKKALIEKQKLLDEELKKRDQVVTKLAKAHADEIAKANKKIADMGKKVSLKEAAVNALKNKLAVAPPAKKAELQKQVEEETKELVQLDAEVVKEVASKENEDAVMEAKKVSAANGQYGIRAGFEHPFLALGYVKRRA